MQQPLSNSHFNGWRFPIPGDRAARNDGSIKKTQCHNDSGDKHDQGHSYAFFAGHMPPAVFPAKISPRHRTDGDAPRMW